ncbi:MAG: magnesium transporter [Candidatus Thorarchaeota archaeon]
MKYFLKIIKESIIIVIISSLFGLFSGTLLSINQEILYALPIILLILPALNSLIGDISTVLVSRLTSSLYLGIIKPKIQKSNRLKEDFFGLLITILLSLIILIFIGYTIAITTGVKIFNPFIMVFILIITVLLLFIFMFVLLFISSIYIFKRGRDPNNFLIPFITSLADFLTPLFLIIFIIIFI